MRGRKERVAASHVSLLALALAAPGFLGTAYAQDTPPAQTERAGSGIGTLEEVIVTGTKREERAQSVPIAISAISAAQIQQTFKQDVRAISELAPNVIIQNITGFNAAAPGIRGTGTNAILVTADSAVGFLIDEFALSHVQTQLLSLFDIDQIEVYRGPQGTLFGKNTTGGVVSINTKKPNLNEYKADVEGKWGRFGHVDNRDTGTIRVGVNVPVVPGKLAMRFAAIYDYSDGYYTNNKRTGNFLTSPLTGLLGVAPSGIVDDRTGQVLSSRAVGRGEALGGKDVFAGRAKVLWQPTDYYELYFIYENVRDRSDSPPGVNETPSNAEILGRADPLAKIDPSRAGADDTFVFNLLGFPGIHTAGVDSDRQIFETGVAPGNNAVQIQKGHRVNVNGYYLNQTFNFDAFDVKSISGVRYQQETLPSTYTGEAFESLFNATRNLERTQAQQELRFITKFDGPFNFVTGGAYYADNVNFRAFANVGLSALFRPLTRAALALPIVDANNNIFVDGATITDPSTTLTRQKRSGWALYWDGTYKLDDAWKLSAGVRYTVDRKNFIRGANPGGLCDSQRIITPARDRRIVNGVCLDARSNAISRAGLTPDDVDQRSLPFGLSAYGLQLNAEQQWYNVSWKGSVSYQLNPDVLFYATAASGFQAGGFTETCSSLQTCQPFQPERNRNVEIGMKSDLFDKTVRLNLAAFWTKYRNLQRNQVVPFTDAFGTTTQETITINAGKSRAYGFEVEGVYVPTEDLRFNLSLGYLNHKYEEFLLDVSTPLDGIKEDLSGLRVPYSAKWNVGGGVTYEWLVGSAGSILTNVNVHYRSSASFSPFDSLYTELEARTLLGANVTWKEPDGRWRVTLYGANLLNEVYRVTANSVAGLWNFTQYGDPREIGVEMGFSF